MECERRATTHVHRHLTTTIAAPSIKGPGGTRKSLSNNQRCRAVLAQSSSHPARTPGQRAAVWCAADAGRRHGNEHAVVRISGEGSSARGSRGEFRSPLPPALRAYFGLLCTLTMLSSRVPSLKLGFLNKDVMTLLEVWIENESGKSHGRARREQSGLCRRVFRSSTRTRTVFNNQVAAIGG